jgi:hypothetical protein
MSGHVPLASSEAAIATHESQAETHAGEGSPPRVLPSIATTRRAISSTSANRPDVATPAAVVVVAAAAAVVVAALATILVSLGVTVATRLSGSSASAVCVSSP